MDNKSLILGDYLFVDEFLLFFNIYAAFIVFCEMIIKMEYQTDVAFGLMRLWYTIWILSMMYVTYHIGSIMIVNEYKEKK